MSTEVYKPNDGSYAYGSVQYQKGQHITVGGKGDDGYFRPITVGSTGNIQCDVDVGTVTITGVGSVVQANLAREYDSVTNYPATNTLTSAMAGSSLVARNSSGTLVSAIGYSALGSAQFIQLHAGSVVPADTAVPLVSIIVAGASNFSIPLTDGGVGFTGGIVICNSTTAATKTIGAADCNFSVIHRGA